MKPTNTSTRILINDTSLAIPVEYLIPIRDALTKKGYFAVRDAYDTYIHGFNSISRLGVNVIIYGSKVWIPTISEELATLVLADVK